VYAADISQLEITAMIHKLAWESNLHVLLNRNYPKLRGQKLETAEERLPLLTLHLMMLHITSTHKHNSNTAFLTAATAEVNNSALITVSTSYQMRAVMDCQMSSLHQQFRLIFH